ncbi:7-deoxyloganetin glucosyltransferase-like [Pyrus x bretschneideri]|uniref:7-deoxyloganetin glucosyltransferase-like n=1 Tax=Pyrus x bretschneideri TaxID=225117 RepID=UPI0020305E00|nr:7-deoxyloganetin glucosyltransferase-like [Pyrus x bretschneideri]
MVSVGEANQPHAVCIPVPAQGHIKAMLQLSKLLHHKGFRITYVNTEFNHRRFLKSLGPDSLDGLPDDFQFETIPDGLPDRDDDSTQDFNLLADSVKNNFLAPFLDLIKKLNRTTPAVTLIVSDGFMAFTTTAAQQLGIPITLFFTFSASSSMGYMKYPALVERGLAPLKDESSFTNGFLDQIIDWIPGMKHMRLRDLPNVFVTTNPNDKIFNNILEVMSRVHEASAIIVHTFDALEQDVLDGLSSMYPPIYAIGPLPLLLNQMPQHPLKSLGYSLWREEAECLPWLDDKKPNSVVYVNFGSITVMTPEQLVEFGWGLAKSKLTFFWVIRPDLVIGKSAIFPSEFVDETKGRSLIASWCPQEQVLNHPSVGGFLTHSGWNSTMESVSAGVPMLCWPFFANQQTNCHCTCKEWGIGTEIDKNVKRDEVEKLVRELMQGEKGKRMKHEAMEWKKLAEEANGPHGSSSANLEKLVNQFQL